MLYELVIGSKFGNGGERKSTGNRAGGSYGGCAFMPSSAASLGSPVARQSPPSCFGCCLRGEAGTAGIAADDAGRTAGSPQRGGQRKAGQIASR